MMLSTEDVRFSYGATPVLKGITIQELGAGKVTSIIGPNAAGKTTFFKCMAGLLKAEGSIRLDGKDIKDYPKEAVTRYVSYLPQEGTVNAVLTVFEAVLLARKHSLSWKVSGQDLEIVAQILADLEIADLATRFLNELSGGQKQLVSIAQCLVRSPQVMLLDEPTSSLDLQRQLEVLDLVKQVTAERKITTLISLHDLNLAARYADAFVVMNGGQVYSTGKAKAVLTPQMLRDVYGVNAQVYFVDADVPQIIPTNSVRRR